MESIQNSETCLTCWHCHHAGDGKHVTCSEGQRFEKMTIDEAEHHSCSRYSYCYFSREHEPMEFMIWLRCNYPKVFEEYNEYKRIVTGPTKGDLHYEVTYNLYGVRKTEDRMYVHYPEALDRAIELSKNQLNTDVTINRCWHDALTDKDCSERVYWYRGGMF